MCALVTGVETGALPIYSTGGVRVIKKQGSVYHFRRKVPLHLQPLIGKTEIWASLRTSRPTTARARAGRIYALTEELFDPSTCTDPARWELEIAKLAAEVAGLELGKFKRTAERSEERRVGKEWVSTCKS